MSPNIGGIYMMYYKMERDGVSRLVSTSDLKGLDKLKAEGYFMASDTKGNPIKVNSKTLKNGGKSLSFDASKYMAPKK